MQIGKEPAWRGESNPRRVLKIHQSRSSAADNAGNSPTFIGEQKGTWKLDQGVTRVRQTAQQPQTLWAENQTTRVTFAAVNTNKQPVPKYCTEIPPGVLKGKEKTHVLSLWMFRPHSFPYYSRHTLTRHNPGG